MAIAIDRLDHFVLTVADVEATCRFYETALGMRVMTFGEGRKALAFGRSKINLHQIGQEIVPNANSPAPGSGDFCLVTETPMEEVVRHLCVVGVAIEEGPVARTGALGPIISVYFRDLDRNLVEVSAYATS